MAMKDLASHMKVVPDTSGTPINIQGFNSVTFVLEGDGTNDASLAITHGDTASTATESLEPLDLTKPIADVKVTASIKSAKVGYIGSRQFVKAEVTESTGTPTVHAVLMRADLVPVE